jgi:hypothetical protein
MSLTVPFLVLLGLVLAQVRVLAAPEDNPLDLPARLDSLLAKESASKLKLGVEFRSRVERRTGQSFGAAPDLDFALIRTRFSLTYEPSKWLKFSAMMQDSRSPGYGSDAPATFRDPTDLQESYFEIGNRTGFGGGAGRAMFNYGEARLIGSPQWSNVTRTFDHARAFYRQAWGRIEFLYLSPVKVRTDGFNRPVLGDRIWGTYNSFPKAWRESLVEVYALRHDQNRPGGFTGGSTPLGTDTLEVNSFGGRWAGNIAAGWKYSLEGILQNGKVGPASHRAGAWFSGVSRRFQAAKRPLDLSAEYKYASGTDNPANPLKVSTFDQLYPANHDKFGHEDLFGWRNIHNARSLAILGLTKSLAFNVMYDSFWIASAKDALYNGAGRAIARSPNGTAGHFVGQEIDTYLTLKVKRLTFGGGYGHFFSGGFIRKTTPGVGPNFLYFFQSYTL